MGREAIKVVILVAAICLSVGVKSTFARTDFDIDKLIIAAEQGDVDAQFQLGELYANGHDVEQNEINAYAWSSLAAEQGEVLAARHRDAIASHLSPDSFERAQKLVANLQTMIASQKKEPPSLRFWPTSPQSTVSYDATLASWIQSIKPAGGGN